MYEMLAGSLPFDADSAVELMSQHINVPPRPLAEFGAVEPAVEAIVARAMAKRPEDRFQTAGSMLAAIEEVLAAEDPADPMPALSPSGQRRGVPTDAPTSTWASIPPAVTMETPPAGEV